MLLTFSSSAQLMGKVHFGFGAVGKYLYCTSYLSRGRFQAYILPLRKENHCLVSVHDLSAIVKPSKWRSHTSSM